MEARKQWKQVILPTGLVFWFGGCHYCMLGLGLNLNLVGSLGPIYPATPHSQVVVFHSLDFKVLQDGEAKVSLSEQLSPCHR